MGAPTIARSPQASTPAQGGKGGGTPMPAQGGKGGRPMPAQGGKGGRPMPAQGGKAPVPMGGMLGGGYPQRDYGYGNQLPPQGGKGGTNDALSGSNYTPRSGSIPPQGGKTPLTPEQLDALGPYINNRPLPPQVQQPAPVQQPVNPYADNVAAPQLADTINSLTPKPIQPVAPQVQQPFPGGFPQRDLGYGNQFNPRMLQHIQRQQEEQQRQAIEQQRRQQEMIMRLPPRLRQQYMQQMQQGQQPSNLGLGGLRGLLGGFR